MKYTSKIVRKNMLLTVALMLSVGNTEAVLSIKSSNLLGFDNTTSAVVDNTGAAIAVGTGYVGVGSFGALTDIEIQALGNSTDIDSSFSSVGSTDFNVLDGLWDANIEKAGDTSGDVGTAIFTVLGNGADISSSTQFLIYRHSSVNGTGNFNETPNANGDALIAEGAGSTGSIVVGAHGNFQHDFGAGSFDAYNLVVVPEPSSTALLGLGGVALFLRRRR